MNTYAVIAVAIVATLVALAGAAVMAGGNDVPATSSEQTTYVYEVSVENPLEGQKGSYVESYVVDKNAGGFDVKVYVDGAVIDSYVAGPEWLNGIRDISGMESVGTVTVKCMGQTFEAAEHGYGLSGGWGTVASANGTPLIIEESQLWSGGVVHTEVRTLTAIHVSEDASDTA